VVLVPAHFASVPLSLAVEFHEAIFGSVARLATLKTAAWFFGIRLGAVFGYMTAFFAIATLEFVIAFAEQFRTLHVRVSYLTTVVAVVFARKLH
jgi:hypothetical protein